MSQKIGLFATRIKKMVNFDPGKEIEKCFSLYSVYEKQPDALFCTEVFFLHDQQRIFQTNGARF